MICPECGFTDIVCNDNLHSIYQCRHCGFQGDGSEFDPALNDGLYSLWLEKLMGKEWLAEHVPDWFENA